MVTGYTPLLEIGWGDVEALERLRRVTAAAEALYTFVSRPTADSGPPDFTSVPSTDHVFSKKFVRVLYQLLTENLGLNSKFWLTDPVWRGRGRGGWVVCCWGMLGACGRAPTLHRPRSSALATGCFDAGSLFGRSQRLCDRRSQFGA